MKISEEGLSELAQREGVRTKAYRDTRGIWTIGIGHTSAAGPPDVYEGLELTTEQVMDLFAKDIGQYEDCVNSSVKSELTQNQFDALVSICYNIGTGGFSKSSIVRDINSGADLRTIDSAIMMWNKPSEILSRRQSEVNEFNG